MIKQDEELCVRLNYHFKDKALLTLALTHRSKGGNHNERLEFLGDSIINCVIAEALFQQFPKASEGDLSRFRAVLVNRESLGELARRFELGRYLALGAGELKSGGDQRQSILSCAMEAVIGAIYLDSDYQTARQVILQWCASLLSSLSDSKTHKDPKTLLQEYVQAKKLALPQYNIENTEGEAHRQVFTVSCFVEGLNLKSSGQGTSRRRAEQAAAEQLLELIHK